MTQLSGSLVAGSTSLGGAGPARRRLPPRRPGELPQRAAAAPEAAVAATAAGPAGLPAAGQFVHLGAAPQQAAHLLRAAATGAPAAAAAAVAPSSSTGPLAAAGGKPSTAGAPSEAADGTAGSGAAAAGGASAAEPGRQERLDGLLHRDANAAFPTGLPEGEGWNSGLWLRNAVLMVLSCVDLWFVNMSHVAFSMFEHQVRAF